MNNDIIDAGSTYPPTASPVGSGGNSPQSIQVQKQISEEDSTMVQQPVPTTIDAHNSSIHSQHHIKSKTKRLPGSSLVKYARQLEIGESVFRKNKYLQQQQRHSSLINHQEGGPEAIGENDLSGTLNETQIRMTPAMPRKTLFSPGTAEASQQSTQMKDFLEDKNISLMMAMSPNGEKSIDRAASQMGGTPGGPGAAGAMREIKVELTARKPVFEIRGKSSVEINDMTNETNESPYRPPPAQNQVQIGARTISQPQRKENQHIFKGKVLSNQNLGTNGQQRTSFSNTTSQFKIVQNPRDTLTGFHRNVERAGPQNQSARRSNEPSARGGFNTGDSAMSMVEKQGKRLSTAGGVHLKTPSNFLDNQEYYMQQPVTAATGSRRKKAPISFSAFDRQQEILNDMINQHNANETRRNIFGKYYHPDGYMFMNQNIPVTLSMPFSDKMTKSSERNPDVDGMFSVLSGPGDLQNMIQLLQQQRPKVSQTPGLATLRESHYRDFKRLEKSYNDRLKLQKDEIIRLQNEMTRMRELVKKFLTLDQMKQLQLCNTVNPPSSVTTPDEQYHQLKKVKSDGLGELTIEMDLGIDGGDSFFECTGQYQGHLPGQDCGSINI